MATYVVTGANRGIGLEMARQLASRGDRVIATARDPEGAVDLTDLDVRVEALDVTDDSSVASFARAIEGEAVDVLVNNAGVGHTAKTMHETSAQELLRVFHVNAIGPVLVTRAMLANLERGESKLIVNVTSILGSIAESTGSHYAYRASKAALNMLNSCIAAEVRDRGIASVVMHPGWVRTDMGGPDARLEIPEAVSSMLGVFDGLSIDDTGRFVDYKGEPLPW